MSYITGAFILRDNFVNPGSSFDTMVMAMSTIEIMATSIGRTALRKLDEADRAVVLGSTNRGIFLKLNNDWIVYLSHQVSHGPLTINLDNQSFQSLSWDTGQALELRPGRIEFHGKNTLVHLPEQGWSAPPPSKIYLPPNERQEQFFQVVREILANPPATPLLPLLAWWDDRSNDINDPFNLLPGYLDLIRGFEDIDIPGLCRTAQKFIGFGTGLTPSGDDLVLGMLLTINRWAALFPAVNIDLINQAVLSQIRSKTTTLSANLVECAAFGEADERLIAALDGIITGTAPAKFSAFHLMEWGNSSGCDSLAGMIVPFAASMRHDTLGGYV